jgi:hypothetical protein
MPKIFSVYGAFETINENGLIGRCRGWFTDKSEAKAKSEGKKPGKGIGWYGGNGTVARYDAIKIEDNIYIIKEIIPADQIGNDPLEIQKKMKQAALAKLTDKEKELLGIRESK